MAGLTAQYQQTTFTSPTNGQTGDATVVLGNDNATRAKHNAHDADATIHFQSSTNATRPAAGTLGRKWIDADTYRVYYDDGSAWHEIAYLSSGNATISGTLTVTGATATTTIAANAPTGTMGVLALRESVANGYAATFQNRNATRLWGMAIDKVATDDGIFTLDDLTAGLSRLSISAAGVVNMPFGVVVGANSTINGTVGGVTQLAVTTSLAIGAAAATTGAIRLQNTDSIYARNAANTTDIPLITLDSVNVLRLGNTAAIADIYWGRALVALGGGSAATLGTVGGAGPASAAQNSWMRVIDSTGAAFWVPAYK